jgi:hypothetical protein
MRKLAASRPAARGPRVLAVPAPGLLRLHRPPCHAPGAAGDLPGLRPPVSGRGVTPPRVESIALSERQHDPQRGCHPFEVGRGELTQASIEARLAERHQLLTLDERGRGQAILGGRVQLDV